MHINYVAIFIATVVDFIIGAIWYTPIFGKVWGKIHGFDKLTKETQKKMMKKMGPLLALQFITTLVTNIVLAIFIAYQPTWNAYAMAGFFWIGFVVPTQISAVVFGGTKPEWFVTKILIMIGASIICFEVAAGIIRMMM